jgi:hypothetical protein
MKTGSFKCRIKTKGCSNAEQNLTWQPFFMLQFVVPIYGTLNLIRVFWYLKEGVISSKQEAGYWVLLTLPKELSITIRVAPSKSGYL